MPKIYWDHLWRIEFDIGKRAGKNDTDAGEFADEMVKKVSRLYYG
jgi:hypothetical protein